MLDIVRFIIIIIIIVIIIIFGNKDAEGWKYYS